MRMLTMSMVWASQVRTIWIAVVLSLLLLGVATMPACAANLGHKTGTQWAPYMEWSLDNASYSGNPFDLIAEVEFVHLPNGETRSTQMFYAGGNTWKFRFVGTRIGNWTFTTSSPDAELDGHRGRVTINPNPDPKTTGFLTSKGNKFALQVGESGSLEGFLFNVFQHQDTDAKGARIRDSGILSVDADFMHIYLKEARDNGFNVVFFLPMDPKVWTDGENPRLDTFEALDLVVTAAHQQGMRVHFWLWGDAERGYTPPGGINSAEDKRLQRYIAARLAALPGWTMGYGFDLQEWVSEEGVGEWALYMHQHMGWRHLLWARGRQHSELDVETYSGLHHSYTDAVRNLDSDPNRPHHFGERDFFSRSGATLTWTRQHLWRYALAGGHGGHWGYKGTEDVGSWSYPNPEQLRTHFRFWSTEKRFLLDMAPANNLTDGYCLKSADNQHYVFYKESASSIQMDLSGMAGAQPSVAVDAKKEYVEISLGTLKPANQTWAAPYRSDWAIAVGLFGGPPD